MPKTFFHSRVLRVPSLHAAPALRLLSLPLLLSITWLAGCNDTPRISAAGGKGSSTGNNSGTGGTSGGSGGTSDPSGGAGSVIAIPDASAGGSTGASGLDAADAKTCGFENFALVKDTPEVLLVLDRSSSMMRPPSVAPGMVPMAGATLWTDALTALDDVVKNTQNAVHWGLKLFPLPTACLVSETAEVDVAPMNYDKVLGQARTTGLNVLGGVNSSGTPTDLAMIKATSYMTGRAAMNKKPKYIVLATDGLPTCANGTSAATEPGRLAAVNAITAAATAGFKTYVIGIAIGATETTILNDMAVAGGEPRNDPAIKFYPVGNRADLVTSLNLITGQVTNCVFPLSKAPPSPDDVKVTVDTDRVPPSPTDGWSYTNAQNTAIQLNGSYCERVKTKDAKVDIVFGCPNVPIP